MILKDTVVLVTGSGAGIGQAVTVAMAEAGAQIVSADIDGEAAQKSADKAAEFQGKTLAVQADVGNTDDIDRMVAVAVSEFGRLDVIVNNAGVTRRAYIMDLTEEDWDRIHRVNAKGVFFCLQRAARTMIEQGGGRIINIASVAGRGFAGTSNAAYAASKGAVIALTKTAAQQLGPHNINVNAICPGITRTPLSDRNLVVRAEEQGVSIEEALKNLVEPIPIGRPNQPEDIA
ncbi:MAG: SDR family NAD(P)-dependent oxidoreductase, partial [Geminicoccaceae bacterium]